MNTPNIEKLLVRYYNDELPADQTARVAAWIAASDATCRSTEFLKAVLAELALRWNCWRPRSR